MTDAKQIHVAGDWYAKAGIAQGFVAGGLIFLSGQVAFDENGAVVAPHDMKAQAEKVYDNIEAVLRAAGSGLDKVIRQTIYITDMKYAATFREVRSSRVKHKSATTMLAVTALARPELVLEIDIVALAADGRIVV